MTTDEYILFIPVTENQKNVRPYNKKNKQSHKIKATSLKEEKINTSVSKLLTIVTEKPKESKKTVHHNRKSIQCNITGYKKYLKVIQCFHSINHKQSPLTLTNSLVDTHKP